MAFPTYTYTPTNGSTADASQVMQNFNDILNGISDASKDISVASITGAAGGTQTFNGNVILGTSSAKTITFNGSVASTIPVSTNTAYDFGSATLGMRSLYVGGTSTFTTRIMSQATASWTMSLPTTAGSNLFFLQTDGSGNTSWANAGGAPLGVVTKTTTYAAAATDNVILCSGSAFTVTLYDASVAANKGNILRIKKTDASLANIITLATTSSQTIDGFATTVLTLNTQFEEYTLLCDGANWQILDHYISGAWTATTTLTLGAVTTPPTKGTGTVVDSVMWKRQSNIMIAWFRYSHTVAGSAGSGDYILTIPGGLLADVSAGSGVVDNTTAGTGLSVVGLLPAGLIAQGIVQSANGGAQGNVVQCLLRSTSTFRVTFGTNANWSSATFQLSAANLSISFLVQIPIAGWVA